jgi:serine/threonine-protein kinase
MTFQAPTAPAIGDVIAGKYRLEEELGSGGMGTLFVAGHELLATRVAIKFLAPHLLSQKSSVARFLREARAIAQLSSEHIVRVMDVGLENGHPYLVMELLEGRDLYEALNVDGPFPIAEAVDCVLQVLAGIAEAHAAGIVHRDLKPANIFIAERSDGYIVKVLDFGVAKVDVEVESRAGDRGRLTTDTATIGSPSYMAPEQVRAARDVDNRADLWAVGAVLYELITGKLAFPGETMLEIIAAILTRAPESVRNYRDDVPTALESALEQCLERDPSQRFVDAEELARAIAPFGTGRRLALVERIAETLKRGRSPSRGASNERSVRRAKLSANTPVEEAARKAVGAAAPGALNPGAFDRTVAASPRAVAQPKASVGTTSDTNERGRARSAPGEERKSPGGKESGRSSEARRAVLDSPFDRVVAGAGGASQSSYSIDQFLGLPIHERVELVLQRRLRFYAGTSEVSTSIALRWLRVRAASSG